MSLPTDIPFEVLILMALFGVASIYYGARLAKKVNANDLNKMGMNASNMSWRILLGGIFAILISFGLMLAKLI